MEFLPTLNYLITKTRPVEKKVDANKVNNDLNTATNQIENCPDDVHQHINDNLSLPDEISLSLTSQLQRKRFFRLALKDKSSELIVPNEASFTQKMMGFFAPNETKTAEQKLFEQYPQLLKPKYNRKPYWLEKIETALNDHSNLTDDEKDILQENLKSKPVRKYVIAELFSIEKAASLTDAQRCALELDLIQEAIDKKQLDIIKGMEIDDSVRWTLEFYRAVFIKYGLTIEKIIDSNPAGVKFFLTDEWIQEAHDNLTYAKEDTFQLDWKQVFVLENPDVRKAIQDKILTIEGAVKSDILLEVAQFVSEESNPALTFKDAILADPEAVRFLMHNPWARKFIGSISYYSYYIFDLLKSPRVKQILSLNSDQILALGTNPVQKAVEDEAMTFEQMSRLTSLDICEIAKEYCDKQNNSQNSWSGNWLGS